MKSHDPNFVQNRIEWAASKHGLPSENTRLWVDAPAGLRLAIPHDFERPVIYSLAANGEAIAIGVDEICIVAASGFQRVRFDEMREIASPNFAQRKQKPEFDMLSVATESGTYQLSTEKGKPCFALWNILLMLHRIRKV